MRARDFMTRNPDVVTPDEPISTAARVMRDRDVGIVPVVEDKSSMRLRGVITDRDIAVRHVAEAHPDSCRVGDHISKDLKTVNPDADAKDVINLMKREQVRRVPVVEGDNRLVGIIAQADVALEGAKSDGQVGEVVEKISEPGKSKRR